eukprot:TRINITY_DN36660_c0_g1_i1.p1 TRINITY_DN36660_c0_g1~~TRINITY_DN36660_c0_g1_i1.p1  ORF type:complete len:356 (+),score=39.10 TRINITY_DN36660_c0_g1_i1:34-1101(+)
MNESNWRGGSLLAVVGFALRVAVRQYWEHFVDPQTDYFIRCGYGSPEVDLKHAEDIAVGLPSESWNIIWFITSFVPIWQFILLLDVAVCYLFASRNTTVGLIWVLSPISLMGSNLTMSVIQSLVVLLMMIASDSGKQQLVGYLTGLLVYLFPSSITMALVVVLLFPRTGVTVAVVSLLFFALGISLGDDISLNPPTCVVTRPNWGLHWYLHLEVFESFRQLFCNILLLFTPGIVVPFAYKLKREACPPQLIIAFSYALIVVTNLTPSFTDYLAAGLCLSITSPSTITRMKYQLAILWSLTICYTLGHGFLVAWLIHQSANANFFYFVTLAWGVTMGISAIEFCAAFVTSRGLKDE